MEQGIYTTDVFLERSRALSLRMDEVKEHIAILDKELKTEITREDSAVNIIPKVEKLLEVYHDLPSPKAKNDMLKDVLEKSCLYKKERSKKATLIISISQFIRKFRNILHNEKLFTVEQLFIL